MAISTQNNRMRPPIQKNIDGVNIQTVPHRHNNAQMVQQRLAQVRPVIIIIGMSILTAIKFELLKLFK